MQKKTERKEGKLIGSLTGEPYGITKFIGDTKEEVAYKNNVNIMCEIYPDRYPEKPAESANRAKETETPAKTEQTPENHEENV